MVRLVRSVHETMSRANTTPQWPLGVLFLAALTGRQYASAQYPPTALYQNVLTSPLNSNITISYKQPDAGTCMTAFTTQKQYTGYIELPPFTLAPIQQNYSINTFFWFVEARQTPETSPLTVWLNGGPGSSSMIGMFNELGPCQVVQMSDGSYGTQASMWGWDRSSNMLFIDQPAQVGFSYDTLTNASYDLLTETLFAPPTAVPSGTPDYMYLNGTFGSGNSNSQQPITGTANTTQISAQSTWHFLQAWLSAFPQYNPGVKPNTTGVAPAGINLFCESYGGHYGPAFATLFEEMNLRRSNNSIPSNSTLAIQLTSLGIMNGLIDDAVQDYYYPFFAFNNTYGIQAINQVDELNALEKYEGTGQCLDQINACREAMNATDPNGDGDVAATNLLCMNAQYTCNNISIPYLEAGYSVYDIRQMVPSPDPPAAYQEYLNNETVLASIGARVNYTESNVYVQNAFISTGDTIRGGQMQDLAWLLTLGVRVALLYGDADYICNWYGGQAVSLAVAQLLPSYPTALPATTGVPAALSSPPTYAEGFPAAGYADIVVNSTYIGGAVRQYGNLSFSRIYDSGHTIPFYQPETAFTVFTRVILGTDISTGESIDLSSFGSTGPVNATQTNVAGPTPSPTCWVRAWNSTCSSEDLSILEAGQGVVMAGVFYQDSSSVTLPSSSVLAGVPGQPISTNASGLAMSAAESTTSAPLTGVYTATATPTPTSQAAAVQALDIRGALDLPVLAWVGMLVGLAAGAAFVL